MDIVKIQNPNQSFDVVFSRDTQSEPENDRTWVELIKAVSKGVEAHVQNEPLALATAEGELRNMHKFLAIDSLPYYVNKIISLRVLYNVLKRTEGPLTGIVTITYERPPEVDAEEGRKKDGKVRLIGTLPEDVMRILRNAYYVKFPLTEEKPAEATKPAPKARATNGAPADRVIRGREPIEVVNASLMHFSNAVNRAIVTRSPQELSFIINQSIQRLRDELIGGLVEQPRAQGRVPTKTVARRPNPAEKVGG